LRGRQRERPDGEREGEGESATVRASGHYDSFEAGHKAATLAVDACHIEPYAFKGPVDKEVRELAKL
jgi:hypothetical protein